MRLASSRRLTGAALIVILLAGIVVLRYTGGEPGRHYVTAYFDNTTGLFTGDEVRILGVPVGKIESIEPQPNRAKVVFWYDSREPVPADAKAVILSPSLVTARTIQLVPAYTGGPVMADGTVIGQERTAVPVEWDDFREQLERLTDTLQPTAPGRPSALGALVSTTADNLRDQGPSIRDTVIKMAQAFSALGDNSSDLYSTLKNLAVLTSALQSSADLMGQLNRNFAGVTATLANDPDEVGRAAADLGAAVTDVHAFVTENTDAVGTTSDRLASISQALVDSSADLEQLLHVAPSTLQNYVNIYQPAQSSLSGIVAVNNFANPISFICGAIQAASRMSAEESARLCVQYLAPIVKNRQYNFPPLGMNPFVGTQARPNELTYSEDWLRPGAQPPPPPPPPSTPDPATGLSGLMVPTGATP